jgi:site-specific DNA-methyltransferase (adenine-specific)
MKTRHICIIGDSRRMNEVQNSSIHLIVTSPPYWQLKDYGSKNQIGFNDSYEEYINNLNLVWKECYRLLHPGCRMAINIGDQFARSVYYGRYKVIPIRTEIIKFCETIGFDYMGAIIWQKKTTMNTTGGATVMGSYPYARNGIIEIDYEFILVFKKPGKAPNVSKEIKELSKIDKEKWKEYFSGHWYFNGVRQEGHIAMFPVELPKRLIEMFTFVGENVLDPFLGSGTTTVAAILTGRNSIGYEINNEFTPVIKEKIENATQSLFNKYEFAIERQTIKEVNWKKEIEELPYVFHDPVKFDKKIDPKKLKFGSKISLQDNNDGSRREEYFTVSEILAPDLIRLSNGITVRLLGVKPNSKKEKAVDFLKKKILKRQVFLRYDEIKYDANGTLMAYVYMKNKTFINAHLIKYGLSDVDNTYEFKYKRKFESIVSDRRIHEKTH